MVKDINLRSSAKTVIFGLLLFLGGLWFWHSLCGNPLDELMLIRHSQIAPGSITGAWEEAGDGDDGGVRWMHGFTYTYRIPDGRELTQRVTNRTGRLRSEFASLDEPYPVEVEYLPDNPNVSRIKGEGSDSIIDWMWRKAGVGGFYLSC